MAPSSSSKPKTSASSAVVKDEDVRYLMASDFIVVLKDSDFHTPAAKYFTLKRKDWGKTRSESIQRKLKKVLNSVFVINLTEATASTMRKVLYPTAKCNMIYRKHPTDNKRYWGVSHFHELLLDEQRHELYNVFRSVGGKTISWKEHRMWNRSYTSPDAMHPSTAEGKCC